MVGQEDGALPGSRENVRKAMPPLPPDITALPWRGPSPASTPIGWPTVTCALWERERVQAVTDPWAASAY